MKHRDILGRFIDGEYGKKTQFKKGNIPWNKGKTGVYSEELLKQWSNSHTIKEKFSVEKTERFGELIGHVLGDGGHNKSGTSIYYTNNEFSLIERFCFLVRDIYMIRRVYHKTQGNCHVIIISKKKLFNTVKDFLNLENFSEEMKVGFVRAIFDDEGSIVLRKHGGQQIYFGMTDNSIIEFVKSIINSKGIKCGKTGIRDPKKVKQRFIGDIKIKTLKPLYYFYICRREDVIKFYETFKPKHPKKVLRFKEVMSWR